MAGADGALPGVERARSSALIQGRRPLHRVAGRNSIHHRADDAPPYFTIFLVAHIVVPLSLSPRSCGNPTSRSTWRCGFPLTLGLTLLFLPAVKGAIVALQWALKMHGFEYAASRSRWTNSGR